VALRWASALAAFALATQPTFWAERVRTEPGSLAVVLDVSRSMSVATGADPRFTRAQALVERWSKGPRGDQARFHLLGDALGPVEPKALAEQRPSAPATTLVARVRELSEQADLGAIVVVSDGHDTTGAPLPKQLATRVHT